MPKERVVVFDGEDKFIAPRKMVYDKATGEASMVGDGERNLEILPNNPIVSSGRAREEFDEYMRRQGRIAIMPSPVEPDFCNRMNQFISTNGDGLATPEQIMQAYNLFQQNCVEKPNDRPPVVDTPTPPSQPVEERPVQTVEPISEAPIPSTRPAPSAEPAPTTTPVLATPFVPLSVPTLGMRPTAGGIGGGAGGGGEEQEPERKPNLLIWLIVGGVVLYFLTRKSS